MVLALGHWLRNGGGGGALMWRMFLEDSNLDTFSEWGEVKQVEGAWGLIYETNVPFHGGDLVVPEDDQS